LGCVKLRSGLHLYRTRINEFAHSRLSPHCQIHMYLSVIDLQSTSPATKSGTGRDHNSSISGVACKPARWMQCSALFRIDNLLTPCAKITTSVC
jgi:hypothetical protein